MTGKSKDENEPPAANPQPNQQSGEPSEAESFANIEPDDGTSFANIEPDKE